MKKLVTVHNNKRMTEHNENILREQEDLNPPPPEPRRTRAQAAAAADADLIPDVMLPAPAPPPGPVIVNPPRPTPHPLLYILRHYPSVSPADLGGLRLPIHPHSTLLPHPLQTRPLALSSIHLGPRRVLTMHRPLLRVLSLE